MDGEARVMWDLPGELEDAVGLRVGGVGGYGSLETGLGGMLVVEEEEGGRWNGGGGEDASVEGGGLKDGLETEQNRERRFYFVVLGLLSLGVVFGSVGWVIWGYETGELGMNRLTFAGERFDASFAFLFPSFLR